MRVLAGLGFLLSIIAYFRYPLEITIDPAMYLQAAELLLQGKKPYIDFIEINPPLIFYLNLPAVVLAKWTGLSSIVTFKVLFLGFLALMGGCLVRILRMHPLVSRAQGKAIVICYFLLPIALLFTKSAGQREHLFMTAFIPFFFMRTLNLVRPQPLSGMAVLLSLCCAVMACLKPHFVFIVFSLEVCIAWLLHSTNTLRQKEVYIFVAVVTLYVAHFLALPLDVRQVFFHELLPEVVAHYGSFGRTLKNLLLFRWYYWVFATLNVVLLILLSQDRKNRKMIWALAAFGFASVAAYFTQGKGWFYHYIPLIYSTVFSFPWIFSGLKSANTKWLRSLCGLFLCFTMYYSGFIIYKTVKGLINPRYMVSLANFGIAPVRTVVETYSKSGDAIVILSPSPIYSYPLFLLLGRYPGTRYLFHFPMSFYNSPLAVDQSKPYPYKNREDMPAAEVRYLEQIQSDIQIQKPELIMFTKLRNEYDFLPRNFDSFQYFNVNGLWSALKSDYILVAETSELKAFQKKAGPQ